MSTLEKFGIALFAMGVISFFGSMVYGSLHADERQRARILNQGAAAKLCKEQGLDFHIQITGYVECVNPTEDQTNE